MVNMTLKTGFLSYGSVKCYKCYFKCYGRLNKIRNGQPDIENCFFISKL